AGSRPKQLALALLHKDLQVMSHCDAKCQRYRHPFFWAVLLVSLLMLGLYVYAGVMVYRYGSVATDYGWEARRRGDTWYVSSVDPHGAAAGRLDHNDRILAVDDDTRIALVGPNFKTIPPDSTYTVRLARGGGAQQLTLYAPLK